MKNDTQRPLKRSILLACVAYTLLLCAVLGAASFFANKRAQYDGYERYIGDVLRYTAAGIDTDDLAECIRTGRESEKFRDLQDYMDRIRANLNLHFLYIIVPLNTEPEDNIMNVIAAVTDEERENEPDELVYLGMLTGDAYSPATAKQFLDAYESGKLCFFEEISQWGDDYTGLLPLFDSAGNRVAALCMDVEMQTIKAQILRTTLLSVALTLALGAAFAALFLIWADRRVTHPIEVLERSVARFAEDDGAPLDPDALVMEVPELDTDNEVETLSRAVGAMSLRLRDSVKRILSTEQELARMSVLAHKDGLTHVGNVNAYNQYCEGLQQQLEAGGADFAFVLMDVNLLKEINDSYGHEKGDEYLKGCCRILCEVYRHSPVFRIGGDEFVAILVNRDYTNRAALFTQARASFDASAADGAAEPWERCSAALGMADSRPGDRSVAAVRERADQEMYRAKTEMHAFRP